MIGYGVASAPEYPPVHCGHCSAEMSPDAGQQQAIRDGEKVYCCDECAEGAPLGFCDSCGKFGPLRFVPFGPGNSVGDGNFCVEYSTCGKAPAKRGAA